MTLVADYQAIKSVLLFRRSCVSHLLTDISGLVASRAAGPRSSPVGSTEQAHLHPLSQLPIRRHVIA